MPTLLDPAHYIDNGFYRITEKEAKRLCGTLPDYGRERLVQCEEDFYWIARTITLDKEGNRIQVWSVRDSHGWYLRNGQAVLGGEYTVRKSRERLQAIRRDMLLPSNQFH
jgi:hypothetical protein